MIRVKIIISLSVDEEEYPIPSDGKVGEEIEDYLTDIVHEVDGLKIKSIKTITQET